MGMATMIPPARAGLSLSAEAGYPGHSPIGSSERVGPRPQRAPPHMTHHTPHQKGIIKRFYEHRDTIALQKLGEIISNLYVETNERKIATAWRAAEKHLLACGVSQHEAGNVV